jgi:sigma-B regulation protein RsbU (phosphoserine phosphatase)
MLLNLTNYSTEPIYNQIVKQILIRILEEDKLPGDELEPIWKISRQHHIRSGSIKKAFDKLEHLGVISSSSNEKYIVNDIPTRQLRLLIEKDYYNSGELSEYELYKTEINAARQIQNDLLPKALPKNEIIDSSAFSTISDEVGGDFYDFFEMRKNIYALLIGDASGKGFPAAMLISQIQAIVKSSLSSDRTLMQTVCLINSYMKTYSSARNFATLFYGIIDLNQNNMTYINAGHNYPVVLSVSGKIKRLRTTGPALGIISNAVYNEMKVDLSAEDIIFLFTDGLPERINTSNEQFGERSFLKVLTGNYMRSSEEIIDRLNKSLLEFSDTKHSDDDTTFMVIKIKNKKKADL